MPIAGDLFASKPSSTNVHELDGRFRGLLGYFDNRVLSNLFRTGLVSFFECGGRFGGAVPGYYFGSRAEDDDVTSGTQTPYALPK